MKKAARQNRYSKQQTRALTIAKRLTSSIDGITGVDFGWMYQAGVSTRRQGIRFHVARKLSPEQVDANQMLPTEIRGIPCDVIQAKYSLHAKSPRSAFDPIRPGISTGNLPRHSTGTIGLFVQDLESGSPCLLSNWHVLCGSTQAQTGDPITQPGPQHLGTNAPRTIAELLRFIPLSSGFDAAIAAISGGVGLDQTIFDMDLRAVGAAEPEVGMRLVKSGALSGTTNAVVDGLGGTYQMDYSAFGDDVRWMDGIRLVPDPNQPEDEISLEGDSGAVWIEPQEKLAVALHFAGEDGLGPLAEYAIAHPLPRVFELLNISLLSQ